MKRNKSQEITRNIIIMDLMKHTGWSRKRVVKTLNFMETAKQYVFLIMELLELVRSSNGT